MPGSALRFNRLASFSFSFSYSNNIKGYFSSSFIFTFGCTLLHRYFVCYDEPNIASLLISKAISSLAASSLGSSFFCGGAFGASTTGTTSSGGGDVDLSITTVGALAFSCSILSCYYYNYICCL
jgi:hypothetical protein